MEQLVEAIKGNPLAAVLILVMGGNTGWDVFAASKDESVSVPESQVALLIYRVEQLEEEIDKLESAHQ